MPWRIKKDRWPNGRPFWTVENREENQVLIGEKGGVSLYYDRGMAQAARDEMNGKRQSEPTLIEP